MIVREKSSRYIALTWSEFCAHIAHDSGWLPLDAVVMGHKCYANSTRTGYLIVDKSGEETLMNEDTVLLFFGDNSEHVTSIPKSTFWDTYEQAVFW